MNRRKKMGFLGVVVLCLVCLWGVGGKVRAAEQGEAAEKTISYDAAMRSYFKNQRIPLGKSGHCYYTDINRINGGRKNGIAIVGLQETVKEIRIPEKIKGKKVVAIYLVDCFNTLVGDYDEAEEALMRKSEKSFKKKSKTKSIVIPRYVDEISDGSIDQLLFLKKVKKFKVSSKNRDFSAKSGVLFSKDGKTLLNYPDKRKVAKYRIPKGVTDIYQRSFLQADVKHVVVPDTVKSIGFDAFSGACIKKISLPENLKSIENFAFSGCELQEIVLPKGLKSIGYKAFAYCEQLQEIAIPGKVKKIPELCFQSCKKLRKVTIKSGVKKMDKYAFQYCYHLKKVIIPSSVKKIGDPFSVDPYWEVREENREAWKAAGVTIYVKKGSYAYRKLKKAHWMEEFGIKVKSA